MEFDRIVKFKVTQEQFAEMAEMGNAEQESYMESLVEDFMDMIDSWHLRGDMKSSEYHASVESIDSEVDSVFAQFDV